MRLGHLQRLQYKPLREYYNEVWYLFFLCCDSNDTSSDIINSISYVQCPPIFNYGTSNKRPLPQLLNHQGHEDGLKEGKSQTQSTIKPK